jgi:molybdopterin-guanine dinucleotide biosynthesis protein B
MDKPAPPAFGFAGYSGSGKTTLMEGVIPLLVSRGCRVSVIKHTHHAVDLDRPGKDSFRHRSAGASEVLLASETRWALLHESRGEPEAELPALLERLSPCDLVLVEGFKRQPIPRIEIRRAGDSRPPLYLGDPHIVAVATDTTVDTRLPVIGLSDYNSVAAFILGHLGLDQWIKASY